MRYKVTVKFSRKNPTTGRLEDNEREGVFEAPSAKRAKTMYLNQFKKNEPTRRRIKSVEVVEVADAT